jgi:putative tryptophan/tyrosine transport system substrate-binding protein
MRRREFIALVSGVSALPVIVQAQHAMPVIGLLAPTTQDAPSGRFDAIHLALRQAGLEVGKSVRIEYRYANNDLKQLPALAAELVAIPATVIISTGGLATTLALKAATTEIPIVFASVPDPVRSGLVASMARPGGNMTGIAALTLELDPKRLELLHEAAAPGPLGVLVNPTRPDIQTQVSAIEAAAQAVGRDLVLASASSISEIEQAAVMLKERSITALLVGADAFFSGQRAHIVALANRNGWPAIYQWREFVEIGGFASFGPSLFDSYRQTGIYAARILKGEKPADLPVQQPTKFEFVINLKTANTLGVAVPLPLLARADEVIE